MPDRDELAYPRRRRRLLSGWGRTAPSAAVVERPHSATDLARLLRSPSGRGTIARGLGRSYGDAAQRAGGRVIDISAVDDFTIDTEPGAGGTTCLVTASAGASLDELLRAIVPRGWFVPVTPGTRLITVGGAIAADIHGKNHHRVGSWCDHVVSIRLGLPTGEIVDIGPKRDPELFWATAGGMGLTGIVIDATFRCPAIETSRLLVDTDRAPDLDSVMALMDEGDEHYDYSVAWIDLLARGASTGRSVLTRGRFAGIDELGRAELDDPLAFEPHVLAPAPPGIPSGLLNRWSIRAFNEAWYRRAPVRRIGELQSITTFFHPLDAVADWNRIYGPRGFLQWQFVVPFGAEETLRSIVSRLSASNASSFLAVLKRFGPGNDAPLSFPISGWTLALDIPVGAPGLGPLLDRLDDAVAEAGGRVYLAKDSRLRAELLSTMYPRLDEWRKVRDRVDPAASLQSDLSIRLGL